MNIFVQTLRHRVVQLFFILLISILTISIFPVPSLFAKQITLSWDYDKPDNNIGFKVYMRPKNQDDSTFQSVWIGTGTSCTIDVDDSTTYCFTVRAFYLDQEQSQEQYLESDDSNEACQPNLPPHANAGSNQSVEANSLITLDGSTSYDQDGIIALYHWKQINGPQVSIDTPLAEVVSFKAPAVNTATTLVFQLTIMDNDKLWDTDTISINVTPSQNSGQIPPVMPTTNTPPVANAGLDKTILAGEKIILNGENSYDSDDRISTYYWKQVGGPTVSISNSTFPDASVIAPDITSASVALTFKLTVSDTNGATASDSVTINVVKQDSNSAIDPNTPNNSESNDNQTPNDVPPDNTTTDNENPATQFNQLPESRAGWDKTAVKNQIVYLDGSSSTDPDGTIVSYFWRQIQGPPVTIMNQVSKITYFVAPNVAEDKYTLCFQLTVTDNDNTCASSEIYIHVNSESNAPNGETDNVQSPAVDQLPVANAGPDIAVVQGSQIQLDGSGSKDTEGELAKLEWKQIQGPNVDIQNANLAICKFNAPSNLSDSTILVFQLTVTDNAGQSAIDTCNVEVYPPSSASTTVKMLSIIGPKEILEETQDKYELVATMMDGTKYKLSTNANWQIISGSEFAAVTSDGTVTTDSVPADQTVTLHIEYQFNNIVKTASKDIIIKNIPDDNIPPETPQIIYPSNNQLQCSTTLMLKASAFVDQNQDRHAFTRWQISDSLDFTTLQMDIASETHKTAINVPHMILDNDQTYYVRVAYYDDLSLSSEWSVPVAFHTAALTNDINQNGIPDSNEVYTALDLNHDGVIDDQQNDLIKSIASDSSSAPIGICKLTDTIDTIEKLATINIDLEHTYPPAEVVNGLKYGVIAYHLKLNRPGAIVKVRVFLSEPVRIKTLYKYDMVYGWQNYSNHITVSSEGDYMDIELMDGGFGDSDGIANGIIIDPFGIIVDSNNNTSQKNADDAAQGGCFISSSLPTKQLRKVPNNNSVCTYFVILMCSLIAIGLKIRKIY